MKFLFYLLFILAMSLAAQDEIILWEPNPSQPVSRDNVTFRGEIKGSEAIKKVELEIFDLVQDKVAAQPAAELYYKNDGNQNAIFQAALDLKCISNRATIKVQSESGKTFTKDWMLYKLQPRHNTDYASI